LGVQFPPGLPFRDNSSDVKRPRENAMIGRWILLAIVAILAVLAAVYRQNLMTLFQKSRVFYKETEVEMKKVTWPSKDELIGQTIVVLVVVVILTGLISIWDTALGWTVQHIILPGSGQ
jgi:preprotein translocase subunit SecE